MTAASTIDSAVLRFVELCGAPDARTAAYDDLGIWHDPGNGQFAKPGWSTAKGMVLGLVNGLEHMAREHVRHSPQGGYITARDDHLRGIGVPRGSNVRVKYLNDKYGIIDVVRDGELRPHIVPWSRFSDDIPDDFAPHVARPEFTGMMNRPNEERVGLVNRLAMNGGKGYVEVTGNELNRYGVPVGSVLEATLRDDGSVTIAAPDGKQFRVPPRLLEPSPPPTPSTPTTPDTPDVVPPAPTPPSPSVVMPEPRQPVTPPTTPGVGDIEVDPSTVSDATQAQIDKWRKGRGYGDNLTPEEDTAERRMAQEYDRLVNPDVIGLLPATLDQNRRRAKELEAEHDQFVKAVKTRQRNEAQFGRPTVAPEPTPAPPMAPLDRAPNPGETFTGGDVAAVPDGTEVHANIIPDNPPLRFVKREDGLHRLRTDGTEDPTGQPPIPLMEYTVPQVAQDPQPPEPVVDPAIPDTPPVDGPAPAAPDPDPVPPETPEPVSERISGIADAAEHYGVAPELVAAALRDLPEIRRGLREQASARLRDASAQLDRADAARLARPPALTPKRQINGSTIWSRGAGGEWDWFDLLSKPEQERLRQYWMVPTDSAAKAGESFAPDQLQQRIADAGVGADVSDVDSAMAWWLHQTRVVDGLRSVASGRRPARNGLDADALGLELADGVKPSDVVGRDRYDAAGAIAAAREATEARWTQEEIDMASQYLSAAYSAPEGERPWELGFVRWVAEVDDYLDAASAYEEDGRDIPFEIAARIDQLLPLGMPENRSMPEAYDEIATMAEAAGETVNVDQPATPDATNVPDPNSLVQSSLAVAALFDRIHEKPQLADKNEAEALAADLFAHDLGGGYTSTVTRTNPVRSGALADTKLEVTGEITDSGGRPVGKWAATIAADGVDSDSPLAAQDPIIQVSIEEFPDSNGSSLVRSALAAALSDQIAAVIRDKGFDGPDPDPIETPVGDPVEFADLAPGDTFHVEGVAGRWMIGNDNRVYRVNDDGSTSGGDLADTVTRTLGGREFTAAEPVAAAFPAAPELGATYTGNVDAAARAVASGRVGLNELRDTFSLSDDQMRAIGRAGGDNGNIDNGSFGFAPLPKEMFHVTTAADAVLEQGLRTAAERQGETGTLGLGGSSGAISLASDMAHAEAIRDGLLEAVDVASGNITFDDMVRRATAGDKGSAPFGDKFVAQMKYTLGLPAEWQPGDPIEETNGRDPLDLWKQFALMRMNAGGPRDPLIMTSSDNLRRINPDQVQIMSVAPANDKAMGVPLAVSGTADDGEWRIPTGQAVTVTGIADPLAGSGASAERSLATESVTVPAGTPRAKRLSPTTVGQMVADGQPLWNRADVADDAQSMALMRTQAVLDMNDPADLNEDMGGPLGTAIWREQRGYQLQPSDREMLAVARREPEAVGKLFARFRRQYEGKSKDSKVSAEIELPPEVRVDVHAAWEETVTHPALVSAFDRLGIDPPRLMLSRYRNPWDNDRDANGTYEAGSDTVWINSTDFWAGVKAGLSDEEARSYPIGITEPEPPRIGQATTSAGDRRAVMVHETGHYVHDHLAGAQGGFVGTPLADEWKRMWEEYHAAYQKASDAGTGVPGAIGDLHKRQLSFYSHENFKEGFAETFGLVARGADPGGLDPAGRALFDWMSKNVFGLAPDESYSDLAIGQTYSVKGVKIQRTPSGYINVATGEPVGADGKPL